MFEKMIQRDEEIGNPDDYAGPGVFISLAFTVGLILAVWWVCLAVYEAMV